MKLYAYTADIAETDELADNTDTADTDDTDDVTNIDVSIDDPDWDVETVS